MAGRDLPDDTLWPEDELIPLSKQAQFAARHVLTSRPGVALHINAFNFPCWGMLENWRRPAGGHAGHHQAGHRYRAADAGNGQADRRQRAGAGRSAAAGLRRRRRHVCAPDYQDAVTFTGSAQTGQRLRAHPRLLEKSIAFTMEADSLNCCVLAEDVTPEMPEFALFIKEVCREMTAKAGQKCTAIRRIIVPAAQVAAVRQALLQRPAGDGRRPAAGAGAHGALVSHEQRDDVQSKVDFLLRNGCEPLCGAALDKLEVRATVRAAGRFIRRPCCIAPIRSPIRRCTALRPSARWRR